MVASFACRFCRGHHVYSYPKTEGRQQYSVRAELSRMCHGMLLLNILKARFWQTTLLKKRLSMAKVLQEGQEMR